MVSVNGNENVNNRWFVRNDIKSSEVKKTNEIVTPDSRAIGEYGDQLLEQVQATFVQAARIPEFDRLQLTEMFAMAGITKPKMPTVAQYASIANQVGNFTQDFDKLTTTNNAERLFGSKEFEALNNMFGIS